MREAALVIGHGGFGTTMTALAAGVPQLVLPLFSSDQFLNAERIQAAGVGIQLLGGLDALPEVPGSSSSCSTSPVTPKLPAGRRRDGSPADVTTTVAVLEELAGH